jgi:hypothetical protein
MVDGPAQQGPARAAAEALLAAYPRVARVVLARMDAADPLVDVVTR